MSATDGWQFVDTNVLVYAYDRSAGEKHERAQQLMAQLWRARSGCMSVQVLQEFYTVVVRKKVFADITQLNVIIEDLTHWQVYTPTARDVLSAALLHQRYQISFWDAMILHSAAQLSCEILWSEDLNAGQKYTDVVVANPFTPAK